MPEAKMFSKELFKTVVEHAPLVSIDIIAMHDDKVLLGKRINKPALGYFFTTGGIVRKNETLQNAMHRIIEAELGITTYDVPKFIGVFEHFYEDGVFDNVSTHYVNVAYMLELEQPLHDLPKAQHSEYRWFDTETLLLSSQVHAYVKDYFKKERHI